MRSRALNVAAAVSLLLFGSVAVVWLETWSGPLIHEFDWRGQRWEAHVTSDGFVLHNGPQVKLERAPRHAAMLAQFRRPEWHQVRFSTLLMLTILAPLAWGLLACRNRQSRVRATVWNRRCRRCGYDLRASPCRCPECGKPVSRWTN